MKLHRIPGRYLPAIAAVLLVLVALACNAGGEQAGEEPTPTVEVPTLAGPLPTSAGPTSTPGPTATPPEDTSECPFRAAFVTDVSIPDGAIVEGGSEFTKTWRIQNDGCQDWTAGTILVFDHGEQMGGPSYVGINITAVGSMADVSVTLTAPTEPGEHTGYWQCQSPTGVRFCQVYVLIVVPEPPTPTPTATATVEPTATSTPQIVTITQGAFPLSGSVGTGGCNGDPRAGIAPSGDPMRAGWSFDVSALAGKEIISATLYMNNYTLYANPFEFLHPLHIRTTSFTSVCDSLSGPDATVLADLSDDVPGLATPIDVTAALSAHVNAESPASLFQVRAWFENDDAGAAYASRVEWNPASLVVEFIP